ncbi:MAG: hypothetical protein QOF37_689 [Thermoleophilaceae bacterium]|nr:hypothetical protein [Thermoleophilaceae bacterium]
MACARLRLYPQCRRGQEGRDRSSTLRIARFIALFTAAFAVFVGAALALPGGAKYLGQTAHGGAVSLRLSGDAKYVKRMRIHYTVTCSDHRARKPTYTDVLDARLRSDGTFKGSGSYQGTVGKDFNKFKVSGQVTPGKAHGTFSLTSTTSTVNCKTGKLTWSAKRQS